MVITFDGHLLLRFLHPIRQPAFRWMGSPQVTSDVLFHSTQSHWISVLGIFHPDGKVFVIHGSSVSFPNEPRDFASLSGFCFTRHQYLVSPLFDSFRLFQQHSHVS